MVNNIQEVIKKCETTIPDSFYGGREKIIKTTGDNVFHTFGMLPNKPVFAATIDSEKAYFALFNEGNSSVYSEFGSGVRYFNEQSLDKAIETFSETVCFNSEYE